MIIDFNHMKEEILHHFKDGDKYMMAKMVDDGTNKIMVSRLISGASIGKHTHETSSEIIYILEGHGISYVDDEETKVGPGCCQYCPKGHSHQLINIGTKDLVFFAVVPAQ